jgi:6-pyruvoyltetrahydropterin/6-carboxytetrahydropterin synthase
MFELVVERSFPASHAVTVRGVPEAAHDHLWRVAVTVRGRALDDDGLLCDFHLVEGLLDEVIGPLRGADLNRVPPFDRANPSAEAVARHIARRIAPALPAGVALRSVAVTEARGCTAIYRPGKEDPGSLSGAVTSSLPRSR